MKNQRSMIVILGMALIIAVAVCLTACGSKPSVAVGDIVQFGGIDWRVLEVKEGNALVLSDKVLLKTNYNETLYGSESFITWEECALREYLNGEFYDSTFSAEEKAQIIDAELKNNDNPWWPKTGAGGNDTTDKVFLLSLDEVLQYFGDSGEVEISDGQQNTIGIINDQFNGARMAKTQGGEAAWWWLRSPGSNVAVGCSADAFTASVSVKGDLNLWGDYVLAASGGVRPALWLKLNREMEIHKNNGINDNAPPIEAELLPDAEPTYTMPEIKSDSMEIMTHVVSSYEANCYFVTNKQTQEAVIIDPGDDADLLSRAVEENGLKPVAILFTHSHIDHIGAAEALKGAFEIPIYAWIYERDNFGEGFLADNITWLDNDDTPLEMAGFSIKVMHTPGHTVGSVCYYVESENLLFSGDTMFLRTYGRTDLATGDLDALVNSFKNKLYILPDNIIVYPGHGATTTVGAEKEHNAINGLLK